MAIGTVPFVTIAPMPTLCVAAVLYTMPTSVPPRPSVLPLAHAAGRQIVLLGRGAVPPVGVNGYVMPEDPTAVECDALAGPPPLLWKLKPSCRKGTSTGHRSVPARLRYYVKVSCSSLWRVLAQRRPLCSDAQLLCREWRSPHRCRPTTKLKPRARMLVTKHSITSVRSDISNLRWSTCKLTALLRMIATL